MYGQENLSQDKKLVSAKKGQASKAFHFSYNQQQSSPGLPDGLYSNQKSQFWYILERLGMENVGIVYDHLEYFTAIWYILCNLV
jgi:hypothetical protein